MCGNQIKDTINTTTNKSLQIKCNIKYKLKKNMYSTCVLEIATC